MYGRVFYWLPLLWMTALTPDPALASDPIILDGLFDDWNEVTATQLDPAGDGTAESEDFSEIRITNDENYLFIYLSFHGPEELLQAWNTMRLFIDADEDPGTGRSFHGIGAELEWCFGCRSGTRHNENGSRGLRHANISILSAPSVTSKIFEVCIARDAIALDSDDRRISIVISSSSSEGDLLPDQPGGFPYTIDAREVPPARPININRPGGDSIRLATYNVKNPGILNLERAPHFQRIFQAIDADIWLLQEQNSTGAGLTDRLRSWFPGSNWHVTGNYRWNFTASKYPIIYQGPLTSARRTIAALIDTSDIIGTPLLTINSHLPCCTDDDGRQRQADELMEAIRILKTGDGAFELPEGTPIIHAGDFNLVGYSSQLRTLTDGDIQDEQTYGPDFEPDWDGSPLADLPSRHTHDRMAYTWRSDNSTFWPEKLDYILYTRSAIRPIHSFTLETRSMPVDALADGGLRAADTVSASDHLPRVVDLAAVESSPLFLRGDANSDGSIDISDGINILGYLFLGENPPTCLDSGDSDDSGLIDLSDGILIFNFLFLGGNAPDAAAPSCRRDKTDDGLDCAASPACQ